MSYEASDLVRAASWNVAAVNNNPFEYWVTSTDPNYNVVMEGVQNFVSDPGRDFQVNRIFTDEMFADLVQEMRDVNLPSLDKVENFWMEDYSMRMAIGGFLKDKSLGLKRLSSMPDRITNTIHLQDGSTCMRPSAINAYQGGSLKSIEAWWSQWKCFMFHTPVSIFSNDGNSSQVRSELVCNLLGPILRSKYPAITVEEQAISVPLQLLCLAILDAIFIHVLNDVGPAIWEGVRQILCDSLISNKAPRTCRIIAEVYPDMDVFFVQEAAAIFVQKAAETPALRDKYAVLLPANLDGRRAQNSLIFLDRRAFRAETAADVTHEVAALLDGVFLAPGDLLVSSVQDSRGRPFLLASFHGDSNGLSTQPFMRAVGELARGRYPDHTLLVGLDANTYSAATDIYYHAVDHFSEFLRESGFVSLWGHSPDPAVRTTCSARTYLQTQINKATPIGERSAITNQNLKDWIVGFDYQVPAAAEGGWWGAINLQ